MKPKHYAFLLFTLVGIHAAEGEIWTNFIRQVQVNSGTEWDVAAARKGQELSALAIDPGGARFEVWTVANNAGQDFLLDQKYVGSYVPQATVAISSEDPYQTAVRTRADRPFTVTMDIDGIVTDPSAPMAARMVKICRYVQEYGPDGNELTIDRDDATLYSQGYDNSNGSHVFQYPLSSLPGDDRSKLRGEETFTVYSLPDYQVPELVLSTRRLQVWPVADGSISGLQNGDSLRFNAPQLTITLNDLYPDSRTFAQVYKGGPSLGTEGVTLPGSAVVVYDAVPADRVLVLDDWDTVIDSSGQWTMEVLTQTPFGIDRLAYVSFSINRDITVNGTVTTIE